MKKILFSLMLIFLLSGCTKEKEILNILNWSSYIPPEVIRDFESEYNVKVNYSTYSSNEELLAKVSSASSGTYDLIFPSDYMVEILLKRNMLEKLDKNKLNNYLNIKEEYLGKYYDLNNEYTLPFLAASVVICYNKEIIDDEISSYMDLLHYKNKGEIVILDDSRIVIGLSLLALYYDMNSTDVEELDEASRYLDRLVSNVKVFDSDSPKSFLISKEVGIGVLWNAEAALAMEENKNIVSIYPEEGFNISIDNYAILKNAKNQDNAYLFIDYLLRGDVMAKIINNYPYYNVNIAAEEYLPSSYLNNPITNIDNDVFDRAYFVKNIGSDISKYDKIWASIK